MSSLKEFSVIATLGSGSFASVYKVKRISDGQEYAMKKVKLPSLSSKERENALNEVRILASINHKNIVAYKEAFYDDASQSLCIIMELASGGDLLKKIEEHKKKGTSIPESMIWSYFIQMLQGLRTLHNMKILHRDLKCANIFLGDDGKTIKLGDLNVSKIAEKGLVYTQTGTPYYASPEVWEGKPYGGKSDIWSVGCVVYELCALLPPFRAQNMNGLYQKVLKGNYEKVPTNYSSDLAKVIGMCLTVQPSSRPDCDKLLSNPIFTTRMTEADNENSKAKAALFDLLDTIKMPRNAKDLKGILPKPKYRNRDAVSMADLDAPPKIDEEELAKIIKPRPTSRLTRANSGAYNLHNISIENSGVSKNAKDNSVERGIRERDSNDYKLKKPSSLPPVELLKKVVKPNPIQRAANAVLMDIFRPKKYNQDPLQEQNILNRDVREPVRPIALSKPGSRGGEYYHVADVKESYNAILSRAGYRQNHLRANTPNPIPRKVSDEIYSDRREYERGYRREYSNILPGNNGNRRVLKPMY